MPDCMEKVTFLENLKKICSDSQNVAQVILALEKDYKKINLDGVDDVDDCTTVKTSTSSTPY